MEIHGFNKLTLLDYPGKLSCTIFTGNCNFRCPFCQNASLVLHPENQPLIAVDEITHFLQKRKGVIEGVCITGGEPTLQKDLIHFIKIVKSMGLLVKLDTNGNKPAVLKTLIEQKLIDYVAMDIKNSKQNYSLSVGIKDFDTSLVEESVSFLINGKIPYEFRTTVVAEHHSFDDFISIGEWLNGAKNYYLQAFEDSGDLISIGMHGCTKSDMLKAKEVMELFVKHVEIRGLK